MKEGRNRAVLIIPWFGKLPPYFGVYLKSLENVDIDVLWVSDTDVGKHPDNFLIIRETFDEFKTILESKLKTRIVIDTKRRLTDFKPMLGKVFEEYIGDYEYWGWGDCDLVYGRKFNEFLKRTLDKGEFDIVSMRKDYLSGPVCFLRNTARMRDLFMVATNWRENCALPGDIRLLFDECGGEFHNKLISGEMTMEDCARIHDSMSAVVWRMPELHVYRQDEINESALKNGETIMMKNGILTFDGEEIAVFHYVRAKAVRWFRCNSPHYPKVTNFKIDGNGFYHSPLSWRTRMLQMPCRKMVAAFEAIRKHGFSHILKRSGLLSR